MSHSLVVVVFHNDHLLFTGFVTMICIFLIFITPLFFFPISLLFAFPLFWCDGIYFFTIAKNRTKIEHYLKQ